MLYLKENLKILRSQKGWTQEEAARRLHDAMMTRFGKAWGCSASTVFNMEKGHWSSHGPHAITLVGLADIYDVTIDELLGRA